METKRVAGRRAVVDGHIRQVGQAMAGAVLGHGRQTMVQRDHGDDGQSLALGLQRHIDDHLVDAAVGKDDEAVGLVKDEVAQDDLPEAFDMFQKHGLALAVGPYHIVVIGQRKLDDGVETGKTAVARIHLLDEHARVAGAEEVDQAVVGDGVGADFGRSSQVFELCIFDFFKIVRAAFR